VSTARLAVLISGSGSNMVALLDACTRGDVPAEVVLVAADRACTGLDTAAARGVETALVEPKGFLDREEWSQALAEEVAKSRPDLVVSAGFMRILGRVFVDAFFGRIVNLHPSLLPNFPGAHAVREALRAGVSKTGATVHFVDYEVDHGPVIMQAEVPVLEGDTEESLHARIKKAEHRLLSQAVSCVLAGEVTYEGLLQRGRT
jgi:phosphoribosylglycinamide formyltransferase-1